MVLEWGCRPRSIIGRPQRAGAKRTPRGPNAERKRAPGPSSGPNRIIWEASSSNTLDYPAGLLTFQVAYL